MTAGLRDVRVLVVEDEFLIASELGSALAGAGARLVGPCASAREALHLLDAECVDIAVLDVLLADGDSSAVATRLHERGIPYVLATAAERDRISQPATGAPVLPKPTDFQALLRLLHSLLP